MKLKLEDWMRRRNVSQAQIAMGLGVSRATVNAWLKGRLREGKTVKVYPDLESLEALAVFFECTPGDLLEVEQAATPTGKTWMDFKELAAA